MSTATLRDLLLEEMELLVRTTKQLLARVKPEHWEFRPHESMRTLEEVATHLAQIPAIDLAILQEQDEVAVRILEKELTPDDPSRLPEVMEDGFSRLKAYMVSLPEEEFTGKKTRAFYSEKPVSQAKWLIEIVSHTAHHRAQLFDYLKQLNYDVNMFDLY
jgi:uncharacterized damage-inducible protein DinB